MARKAESGINYYPIQVNHTQNNKIRLLFSEYGADGYWIWKCLLDRIYGDKGYYMDIKNKDELDLFASELCKKKVAVVEEVIAGCVRRDLFDKTVADTFGILTNDRIQLNYLEATSERRRKGTIIELKDEILLIEKDEDWKNVIVTRNNSILPRNNPILPRNNSHSIVNKIIVNENKINIGFEIFWELYDKKAGEKRKLEKKWNSLTDEERQKAIDYVPQYKISQPDKFYRKNVETFLNSKSWTDEIISDPKNLKNETIEHLSKHQGSIIPIRDGAGKL